MCRITALSLLTMCLAGPAFAQVTSLEGANLGTHWFGPKVELDDLKGRCVLVEVWGYN